MVAAALLNRQHDVHLFEASDRLGGHTHTHDIELFDRTYRVDSGFIVYNESNYPLLTRLLAEHEVDTQPTIMSFALKNERSGLEYNATTINTLFSQRRNLMSPRFIGMIRDLLRFYREAPALLNQAEPGPTIGEYLEAQRYGAAFAQDHLLPMASALWSTPGADVRDYPARYMIRFMANHRMLQVSDRPQWRVVSDGSDRYIEPLLRPLADRVHRGAPVNEVRRSSDGVTLTVGVAGDRFEADQVVFACHSDQALAILGDATEPEREILGALRFQANVAVLHWDRALLPKSTRAWAAWNALVPADGDHSNCTVTYNMSLLQSLDSPEPLCVTLNRDDINPKKILARMRYHHPRYDQVSVAAQARRGEISGANRTWYCGAYWGWGFHEDGVRSAVDVTQALGIPFPHA